jgi:hypothetical protein
MPGVVPLINRLCTPVHPETGTDETTMKQTAGPGWLNYLEALTQRPLV